MKIGVITDSFRCPLKEALKKVSALGLGGVQIYASRKEFNADLLNKRQELDEYLRLFKELGLTLSAICGDLGGHGFQIKKDNPGRIEKTRAIIDLAAACGTPVITTHIGLIPADEKAELFETQLEAMDTLGQYAKKQGITLAIETGPERPEVLKTFIERTHGGVGVNLDPANFVMVTGVDPAQAVEILGKYIVHTHVKDGIMKKQTDPARFYGVAAEGEIEEIIKAEDYFAETPVGEGQVNFDTYLGALKKTGYDGFFTIEREAGADPEKDIAAAASYIRDKLGKAGY
jgi:sugar phosphate isomerase/epimerase